MDHHMINDNCIYARNENNELIDCNEISIKNNNFCENHQMHIDNINVHIEMNRKYCVDKLKLFLHDVEMSSGKTNKIIIVVQLFEFLIKHKYFLSTNDSFSNTILAKLYEFDELHSDIFDSQKYIKLLFPNLFVNGVAINNTNDNNDNNANNPSYNDYIAISI